jgi:cobalt-zinc-cadmium efflux system membrane fusion protein
MEKKLILLWVLAFGIACQQPIHNEAQKDYSVHGDTVIVEKDSPLSTKIKTTILIEEPYQNKITTAGLVKAIPTQFAQIAPPFSGRVTKSYMTLGQKVSQGSPLFEISSADFIDFQKAFFQSKSDYQLALQTLNRQKDLLENGVGTKKDLEEAQNQLEVSTQEYKNAAQAIKIFNVDPKRMTLGQNLLVRSPIAGQIIENKLITGQYLKEDTEPLAIVAELSKVWVVAQVKEKDIIHIQTNDQVDIQVSAYPDLNLSGKIFHIQDLINDETRAIEVLIESDNPQLLLKQGMYVTIRFQNQEVNRIILPEKAVLQDENNAFVYIQSSKNKYIKRKIKIAATENNKVIVESGININEIVVSEGGYYLLNAH